MAKFSTLKPEIEQKWHRAAEAAEIPQEAFIPDVKVVEDSSGRSKYTFGVVHNPYRFRRFDTKTDGCVLCDAIQTAQKDSRRNLDPDSLLPGFFVVPNIFPTVEGMSLAITEGARDRERPMYTTANLISVVNQMADIFKFCDLTGWQAFHNSEGAGASIPNHEHWHLKNAGRLYDITSRMYGFEASDTDQTKKNQRVRIMPDFPFAHLIFEQSDPGRIVTFLTRLNDNIGSRYDNNAVPHGIIQGKHGILVVPVKEYRKRGIGSGDMAGHILCQTEEDFESMDYQGCIKKLGERLFSNKEINLEYLL